MAADLARVEEIVEKIKWCCAGGSVELGGRVHDEEMREREDGQRLDGLKDCPCAFPVRKEDEE